MGPVPTSHPRREERAATPRAQVRVDWRAVPAIDSALIDAWSALAADAADANAFAEPWMLRPALDAFAHGHEARVALVYDGDRLIGFAPLTRSRPGRLPVDAAVLWGHYNAFLAAAVAATGEEQRMWGALIDALPAGALDAPFLRLPGMVEGSAMHAGLCAAAAARGLPVEIEKRTVRAMLATDLAPDAYWDEAVRATKRKELRRQWARLGEEGVLTTDRLSADADIAPWIEEFLSLESSGWKGANASALASQTDTATFFRAAMRAGHARGRVAITALRLDGRAIAMLITLIAQGSDAPAGYSFKTAFDEAYARFSPGVLLQRESLSLLHERGLAFIDSCAAQDHPMIDSLWRERRAVLTLCLPQPGARNRLIYNGTMAATRGWHMVKQLARRTPKDQDRHP